jgi:hypothetical protein
VSHRRSSGLRVCTASARKPNAIAVINLDYVATVSLNIVIRLTVVFHFSVNARVSTNDRRLVSTDEQAASISFNARISVNRNTSVICRLNGSIIDSRNVIFNGNAYAVLASDATRTSGDRSVVTQ